MGHRPIQWVRATTLCALCALLPTLLLGCSASDASEFSDGRGAEMPTDGDSNSSGSGAGGGSGTGAEPPPEQELESNFSAPVATGRYVWIANPTSGRVAYIDAETLAISVVDAGYAPTFIAAVPSGDADVAIVLNVLSRDATVLRAEPGSVESTSLPVPSSGNGWAVSKSGRWATAWTDARRLVDADPIDGYQDVTVLDLENKRSTALTVGYRPVAVAYDDAGAHAFAVTQDGVSIIDLAGDAPVVTSNVPLSDDPLEDTSTRDVEITPDGAWALVRRDGASSILVVSLATGARTPIALPAPATDLDLSTDGTTAIAALRDSHQVAVLPVGPEGVDAAAVALYDVPNAPVGSVVLPPESSSALLYTNATASPLLTVLDTSAASPEPRTLRLRAAVQAVFPTPDASGAVVIHGALQLDGGSRYPAAMSLVPIATTLPSKIFGLSAPVTSVAVAPTGDNLLIATSDTSARRYELVVANLVSQQIEVHALASEPIAAGIVAGAKRGYVAQEHPDGRISFIDFDTGAIRTLTGFELASQVVDGSQP